MTCKIVATGDKLIGGGVRTIYTCIEDMIESAEHDILIATFSMSQNIKELLNLLEAKLKLGVELIIIINRLQEQSEEIKNYLQYLENNYDFIKIINFSKIDPGSELHMKVIVVDRKKALIGSANFTWKGLLDNYEIAVYFEGEKADEIYQLISKIIYSQ